MVNNHGDPKCCGTPSVHGRTLLAEQNVGTIFVEEENHFGTELATFKGDPSDRSQFVWG